MRKVKVKDSDHNVVDHKDKDEDVALLENYSVWI